MLLMYLVLVGGYLRVFVRFCALFVRFFGCLHPWNLSSGRLL
jgi:hypothetical protein